MQETYPRAAAWPASVHGALQCRRLGLVNFVFGQKEFSGEMQTVQFEEASSCKARWAICRYLRGEFGVLFRTGRMHRGR